MKHFSFSPLLITGIVAYAHLGVEVHQVARNIHHPRDGADPLLASSSDQGSTSTTTLPPSVPTTPLPPSVPSTTITVSPTATAPDVLDTTIAFSLLSTNPTAVPLSDIVYTASPLPTSPLATTESPGAAPTLIPGAPPLPNAALLSPLNYPMLDRIPPTNSTLVQQWIQEVQNSGVSIPTFSPTSPGGCSNNTAILSDTARCWWSCQAGCTRTTDVTDCPDHLQWGLTYDDGPGFYTSQLLDYLDEQQLKSTFFVVGSRAITFPSTLQLEYIGGHHVAVHTWSHPSLTTLTNEEIIAELGWTKKVIKDILGVTPNMMRPPYGDIDDRVRAISLAMGLTPVMWSRISPTATFDTGDFDIFNGLISVEQVLHNWGDIMGNASVRDTGFIVLEHDLSQQTVEIATGYVLPDALARKLTIEPVISCLNRPLSDAYIETNNNVTNPPYATGLPSSSSSSISTETSNGGGAVSATTGAPGSAQTGQSKTSGSQSSFNDIRAGLVFSSTFGLLLWAALTS